MILKSRKAKHELETIVLVVEQKLRANKFKLSIFYTLMFNKNHIQEKKFKASKRHKKKKIICEEKKSTFKC